MCLSRLIQDGDHVLVTSGYGRYLTSGATTNPQSVGIQTPYLLGQQLPPVSKFSGEDLEGDKETFHEWVEQFVLRT